MTHTYAELEISKAAYDEIADKLRRAGYDHVFNGEVIDMHGLALTPEPMHTDYMRCTVCGFIIDTRFKAEFPK